MYVYKVTNLKTNQFYFGFESIPASRYMENLDPLQMFGDSVGTNGHLPMTNIVKELITKVGSISEGNTVLAQLAKQYESNDNFLGVKSIKKSTPPIKTNSSGSAVIN